MRLLFYPRDSFPQAKANLKYGGLCLVAKMAVKVTHFFLTSGWAAPEESVPCPTQAASRLQGLPHEPEDVPVARKRSRTLEVHPDDSAASVARRAPEGLVQVSGGGALLAEDEAPGREREARSCCGTGLFDWASFAYKSQHWSQI